MSYINQEKESLLTVFTPTYNRAYTLHLNYEALKCQTDKDFVWMIVDDGSTDNTEKLVKEWIMEGAIDIEYYKQVNSGKPAATNFSIENSTSKLWMCVDSDDYLSEDAVSIIRKEYEKIKSIERCAGIVGLRCEIDGKKSIGQRKKEMFLCRRKHPEFVHLWEIVSKFHIKGERVLIFKREKLKNYRFPIIKGEKFIGESYLYEQIGSEYIFYFTDEIIYYNQYREDGLTANYLKLHINNPIGNKLLKEMEIIKPKPILKRYKCAVMYVTACLLCGDRSIIRNSPKKMLTFFAYPLGKLVYKRKYVPLMKDLLR